MTKLLYLSDLKGFAEAKLGWLEILLSSEGELPLEESLRRASVEMGDGLFCVCAGLCKGWISEGSIISNPCSFMEN